MLDAALISSWWKAWLLALGCGVLWVLTYPFLFRLAHRRFLGQGVAWGAEAPAGLAWVVVTLVLLGLHGYWRSLDYIIYILLSLGESSIVVLLMGQYAYYGLYKDSLSSMAILAIGQTDKNEGKEYLTSLPFSFIVGILLVTCSSLTALWYGNGRWLLHGGSGNMWQSSILLVMGSFLYLWLCRHYSSWRQLSALGYIVSEVNVYLRKNKDYVKQRVKRLQDLRVQTPQETMPRTVILVIGESASRDYMSAYQPEMPEDTTPWLRSQTEQDGFVLFTKAYACAHLTVPVLERLLTEANQYNKKKFYKSCSLIDLAQVAGYKTYWFSNQGHIGLYDTPTSLVAHTADCAVWTQGEGKAEFYDGTLLDCLKQVQRDEFNFIVFHLMGSHETYANRYPPEASVFSHPKGEDGYAAYLDSLHYTDAILKEIYEYAEGHLNLDAMLYISDHGANPKVRRTALLEDFTVVRIPLFIYLSKKYREIWPDTYQMALVHRHQPVTNDLIYEMMGSLLQVKSNRLEERDSILSPSYRHTAESLRINLGTMPLPVEREKFFNPL